MNQTVWEMMVTINNYLQPLRKADSQSAITTIDLVKSRSEVRTQLEGLRATVTGLYSERDAYFVLFPLIAHCDEVVKEMILDINQLEWPPLQQEFYQVTDAGDLFYELLENALSKPETLPLVYEVYYFCLNDGFCGRYSNSPDRLAGYLQKLRKHISLQPIAVIDMPNPVPTRRAYFRIPNYVYYLGSGVLLVLCYLVLTVLARNWQPI